MSEMLSIYYGSRLFITLSILSIDCCSSALDLSACMTISLKSFCNLIGGIPIENSDKKFAGTLLWPAVPVICLSASCLNKGSLVKCNNQCELDKPPIGLRT